MTTSLDLTTFSSTFPEMIPAEIQRDNLISLIRDQFSADQKVIVVQGAVGSGKTTLLAQFARTYPDRCFSFFVGTTLPTSHPRAFLMDMCEQLGKALERPTDNLDLMGTEQLTALYLDLHRQIGQISKQSKKTYYFIIDGIEWIPSSTNEPNILKLLPGEPKGNLRLILSSDAGRAFPFKNHPSSLPFFSLKETESYLNGLSLSPSDIQAIHKRCEGMPGYLAVLKRLLLSGSNFNEFNEPLPNELNELIQIEWKRLGNIEPDFEKLLALLGYSREQITLGIAGEILDFISCNTIEYESKIRSISFLKFDPKDKTIAFISDAYKQFVCTRLGHLRESAEYDLIRYYENNLYSKPSIVLLPHYLASRGNHERLRELVTPDYISRALQATHDGASIQRTIATVADQALEKNDLKSLLTYTLASSILASLSNSPTTQSEVEALLELGEYSQAFGVSYDSILLEDRLQLTALIGSRMQQDGISVPENIVADLEQLANAIDATTLKQRAVKIAALLFDLLPEAAIKLVERSGVCGTSESSLDLARAMLVLSLDAEKTDTITSRITDKSLRDFTSATSPRMAKLTSEEVTAESLKISDTSGKIFSLESWCNEHREDNAAWKVVEVALEAITGDQTYAPSMRTLRRLAQAIKPVPSKEVEKLIQRMDLLKSTAIRTPLEETIWLELNLAKLDRVFDEEQGKYRMLEAYYSVETLDDLDSQCYALLRIILVAPLIDPKDSLKLLHEAEISLRTKFKTLLDSSAEHDAISNRLLTALARSKSELAVEFAQQLNTQERRDNALQKVLKSYVEASGVNTDFVFTEKLLRSISDNLMSQYSRVQVIHILSETKIFKSNSSARVFLRNSDEILHPWNKCHALAFAINAMEETGDTGFIKSQHKALLASLELVDSKWEQVTLGLGLASILGKKAPRLARPLFESAIQKRQESPLSEEFFANLYTHYLTLAIRLVNIDPSHRHFEPAQVPLVISLIKNIPSYGSQCELLAKLALQLHLGERTKEFRNLVKEELIPCFELCPNIPARRTNLAAIAPTLYEYESDLIFDRLQDLPPASRDRILKRVLRYVISKCHPDEPIDIEKLNAHVDMMTAKRACQLIQQMTIDSYISNAIEELISAIIVPDPHNPKREQCQNLIERDALYIADRLEEIITQKLPDPKNITHNGYLVVCKAYIARLREAAQRRSKHQQNWESLLREAAAIPNVADRVLVYVYLAEQMAVQQTLLGETALKEAENNVPDIKNPIDRAERLYSIAKAWKKLDRPEAVKKLLKDSILALGTFPIAKKRDEIIEQALELAHSVDPNFASSLAPVVENPIAEHKARMAWETKSLQKAPQNIEHVEEPKSQEFQVMLGRAAFEMNAELNANAGILPHPIVPMKWLRQMVNAKFEDLEKVVSWAITYVHRQNRSREEISGLFQAIIDALYLCINIGNASIGKQSMRPSLSSVALPQNLRLFKAGSKTTALGTVHEWIQSNATEYLIIYDPYFNSSNLGILKSVQSDLNIYIYTSWKAQNGLSPGDKSVEQIFRNAWKSISESDPPWTQIFIVGIRSGDSPIHSRYILTDGKGLNLGTSISGLGDKDSDLRILDAIETANIAEEFIEPLRGPQPRFRNERLLVHTFVL